MEPKFTFPFPPYAIQEQFMRELYFTIEDKKLGIFESPTGTGKSLSICCGALQWLKDNNSRNIEQLETDILLLKKETSNIDSNETQDDWLQEQSEKIIKLNQLRRLTLKLDKIHKRKEMYEAMKSRVAKMKNKIGSDKPVETSFNYMEKHRKGEADKDEKDSVADGCDTKDDEDLLVDDVTDDKESEPEEEVENEGDEEDDRTKIYISSRTHSQLSQFVGEIKRTVFGDSVRVVTLASRQHYCINPDVKKLKNVHLINERCLDMQKSKSKTTLATNEGKPLKKTKTRSCASCPYYGHSNVSKLKDRLLVDIMDMEDLVKTGKEMKACPYYASKMALDDAEVVLVTHAGLVSPSSLRLSECVTVVDEAHGLPAALEQAHAAPVSHAQLTSLRTSLRAYLSRYGGRLGCRGLLALNQLDFVVGRLLDMIQKGGSTKEENEEETSIYTLEDFVIKAEIDHLNLRALSRFYRDSRLAQKLHGFSLRYNQELIQGELRKEPATKKNSFQTFLTNISKKKAEEVAESTCEVPQASIENKTGEQALSAGTALYATMALLEHVGGRGAQGRALVSRRPEPHLKYLLLDPTHRLTDVVASCRAVILAGGTMEPISQFQRLLLGDAQGKAEEKLCVVRCEHVVPPDHVQALCLSRGPANMSLDFTYENRQSKELLSEVCGLLRNICGIVPGGVVCFLPSYTYERDLHQHLVATGTADHIAKKKTIFREPKSAAEVDHVLNSYAKCVHDKSSGRTGALMLSVVGGKLSEGLNFSDDLGRCVVVVGMPYPNIRSPELQERMRHLDRTQGPGAGREHYEGLCMKAVNQCIGRAVRHAQDYACVILADARYSRPRTTTALPAFLQKSLKTNCNFGSAVGSISKFFTKHKSTR